MADEADSSISSKIFQIILRRDRRKYLICFIIASMLWLFGAWNISFAWIILFIFGHVFGEYRSAFSKQKRRNFREVADEMNLSKFKSFSVAAKYLSQSESATWLNNIVNRLWPSIEAMTRNIIKETIEPEIQKNLPAALKTLYFERIELGEKAPFIGNIKTYSGNGTAAPSEFVIDADLSYQGDAQVKLSVKNVKLGISNFQLYGPLRIILKPLLSDGMVVGGITVFFLKRPKISFNLTNLLNVLDIPGLKKTLRGVVDDVIANFVVLPNRVAIPLAESVDAGDLKYPIPEGLLRVQIPEARELVKSDFSLIGKGSPDPYAVLEVGAQTFRTETKKNQSNPKWDEIFEAFVYNSKGQELEIFLYDHDLASKDSKIGNVDIKIQSVVEEGMQDIWLPLEKAKQGKVHLRLEWFSLSNDPLHFRYTKENESVAVLIVKLIKAQNLPSRKSPVLARKVYCRVAVSNRTLSSFCAQAQGDEFEWQQSLLFLLTDPHEEVLIEVMEGSHCLGFMAFTVRKLIEQPDMSLENSFQLLSTSDETGTGTIKCKLSLRALKAADTIAEPNFLQIGQKFNACYDEEGILQRQDTPTLISEVAGRDYPTTSSNSNESTEKTSTSGSTSSSRSSCESSPSGSIADDRSNEQSTEGSSHDYLSRGEVSLKLIYDHRRNRLMVTILNAKNLSSAEPVSKTNTYVQINLIPSRSKKSIRKTFSYPGSLHPVFNETFDYVIGLDQLADKKLYVAVKNEKIVQLPGKRRDVIGATSINLCELDLSAGVTMNCEITN